MGAVICIAIVAFLFLIMSIALVLGKGSWLIAGFNTASAEEKANFDKKKLCRAIGVLCFVVFALLCVMSYLGYQIETGAMEENSMLLFGIIFAIIVMSTLILVGRYVDIHCKND